VELLEQGEALACSSELQHNSYGNRRLELSIILQPAWAFGTEGLLSHWSKEHGTLHAGSRHISMLMSQLTGNNHVLQRRMVQSQQLLGESPGESLSYRSILTDP